MSAPLSSFRLRIERLGAEPRLGEFENDAERRLVVGPANKLSDARGTIEAASAKLVENRSVVGRVFTAQMPKLSALASRTAQPLPPLS